MRFACDASRRTGFSAELVNQTRQRTRAASCLRVLGFVVVSHRETAGVASLRRCEGSSRPPWRAHRRRSARRRNSCWSLRSRRRLSTIFVANARRRARSTSSSRPASSDRRDGCGSFAHWRRTAEEDLRRRFPAAGSASRLRAVEVRRPARRYVLPARGEDLPRESIERA